MLRDNKIWVANTESGENVFLLPKMANRHGLIAGATETESTLAQYMKFCRMEVTNAILAKDIVQVYYP